MTPELSTLSEHFIDEWDIFWWFIKHDVKSNNNGKAIIWNWKKNKNSKEIIGSKIRGAMAVRFESNNYEKILIITSWKLIDPLSFMPFVYSNNSNFPVI